MSKKFSDLTQLTAPDVADIMPVDDVSAATTKKITLKDLLSTPNTIDGTAINSYKVVRQNDATNTTETAARILTGWGVIIPGAVNTAIESVTFNTPFSSPPIVLISPGGDHASAATYGAGGGNIQAFTSEAIAVAATGFTSYNRTTSAASWNVGNTVFYQWIAIGV